MKVHNVEESPPPSQDGVRRRRNKNQIYQFLDKHLVGKSDEADYSDTWRQQFSHHPSWCDADMCIQQINLGNAEGNRVALYARCFFQRLLYNFGAIIQKWPKTIMCIGLLFLLFCCSGLKYVTIETDLMKLWVEQGGRLDDELNYLNRIRNEHDSSFLPKRRRRKSKRSPNESPIMPINAKIVERPLATPIAVAAPEIPVDSSLSGGFQVVIQTPDLENRNILTKEGLLRHVDLLHEISQYTVEMFGETWRLSDICFKPPAPEVPLLAKISSVHKDVFNDLIPCIWITPIDCFWEGAKPLGPFPSSAIGEFRAILPNLPKGNITWKNLDPEKLIDDTVAYTGPSMKNMFARAGIGRGYQDRLCIDPLDWECPTLAPNYFNACPALRKFFEWNKLRPESLQINLEEEIFEAEQEDPLIDLTQFIGRRRKKRQIEGNSTTITTFVATTTTSTTTTTKHHLNSKGKNGGNEDYYEDAVDDVKTTTETPEKAKEKKFRDKCKKYRKSFLKWMNSVGPQMWDFLNISTQEDPEILEPPKYPKFGNRLTGGCAGFAKNIMKWPEDLIIGGITRKSGLITAAEAFQSVFLVASTGDVFQRISRSTKVKNIPNFTPAHAGAIIQNWQRHFTDRLYEHPLNKKIRDDNDVRVVHPLASTSIQDMLKQFSEFQFLVIFIGYVLMIFYAGYTQYDWNGCWFSVKSSCFLSILGVLTVTYSSIAGLGLSSLMGINFNAATTQIVPFLTLGLGIDDMFLLLHNYNGVLDSVKRKEIAVLLKETGMSILITSTNNILAFCTGIILPIPALRSFCAQTAILLSFNVICIIIIYPTFISLDLRRRKAGIRDMTFGCCWNASEKIKAKQVVQEEKLQESSSRNHLVKNASVSSTDTGLQELASLNQHRVAQISQNSSQNSEKNNKWYTLNGFLHAYYIPWLLKPMTKACVIVFCGFLFSFGCVGLYRSKLGLELADVLPENTPPAAFLRAREKYFSFYPMFVVLRAENINSVEQQDKIEQLRLDIGKSKFVIKGDTIRRHIQEPSEHHWIWYVQIWLKALQANFERALANGQINNRTGQIVHPNLEDEVILARRLICSHGNTFNCTERLGVKLIDDTNVINPDGFYNYLTAWYHVENMMYYVSQASFYPSPPPWSFNNREDGLIPPAEPLKYSHIPFYLTGLTDTPVIVEMIEDIRLICEQYTSFGLSVFPTGIPFTFWEQYLHLTLYLFLAILIIGIAVLLVISVIIFNPWAASMVAVVVISMTVELAGFMGLFEVKLNPISAVTLITAVGIGVEFTAHVVLAFLTSLGSRDERTKSCLTHMFIPVVHGGLSTLLGIIMLAFSEFDFVVKYFFIVMSALIFIGLFNGLVMLPVMLSLIGPPCEIAPLDGGNTLQCPPSQKRLKRENSLKKMPIISSSSTSSSSPKSLSPSPPESYNFDMAMANTHKYHDSLSTVNEAASEKSKSSSSPHIKSPIQTPIETTTTTITTGKEGGTSSPVVVVVTPPPADPKNKSVQSRF